MGGSPKIPPAPEPPDPFATSAAQSAANRDTAVTTALLNYVNEVTPFGSSKYDMTGYYQIPNSIDKEGNPISGGGIPQFFGFDGTSTPGAVLGMGGGGGGALGGGGTGYERFGYKTTTEGLPKTKGQQHVISPDTGVVYTLPEGLSNEQVKAHISGGDAQYNQQKSSGGMFAQAAHQPYTMGAGTLGAGGGGAGGGFGMPGNYFSVPQFTRTTTLSPDQQAILDENERLQLQLLGFGNEQATRLRDHLSAPVSFDSAYQFPEGDHEESRRRVEEAIMSRLEPAYQRQRSSLQSELASVGHLPGTEGYNRELDESNRMYNDALMQSVLAGGQEQSRMFGLDMSRRQQDISEILALRNQPINEIGAILSMGQVQMPQFAPIPQIPVSGTDLEGNVYRGYQGQLSAYNTQTQAAMQQAQSKASTMGSIFGTIGKLGGGLLALSDRRAKTAIRKLAELANGFGLYAFRYFGDATERVGYMADEVRKVSPWAVVEIGGLDHVDYDAVRI